MNSNPLCDTRIVESWGKNAGPWTRAVQEKQIDSRRQVTDHAIVEAVLSRSPKSVLDIGCGEGWLARELHARNIDVLGLDVTVQLIEEAQRAGGGRFGVASYEDIAAGQFKASVDVAVCNFALLGKESVDSLFRSIASLLNSHGSFIVQTLHPVMACGDHLYRDGWREGSWDGFGSEFTDPAPWYFRTLESWVRLFTDSKLRLLDVREPLHPRTGRPASVIFIAGK
jgi:2-polyprenyl-3-methyl-5-hydroxy-6-metoxy-1,4-benzoquinol methylase